MRRRRKAGLPGFCWKTCYFPILFWVVSVCGEENTLIVEVGGPVQSGHKTSGAPQHPKHRYLEMCRGCLCVSSPAFTGCAGMNIDPLPHYSMPSLQFRSVLTHAGWSGVVRSSGCVLCTLPPAVPRSISLTLPSPLSHENDTYHPRK